MSRESRLMHVNQELDAQSGIPKFLIHLPFRPIDYFTTAQRAMDSVAVVARIR